MSNKRFWLEQDIEGFLVFQESLGYRRISYEPQLHTFLSFVRRTHPQSKSLTQELIIEYLDQETSDLYKKASALRLFGRYLTAIGKDSYIIPESMYRTPQVNSPHIFSDQELHDLFRGIDSIDQERGWIASAAPVLFRLIYTCCLRPKEGRELKRTQINFETGEIFIENSKKKKDRTVVMSDDMLNLCRSFDGKRSAAGINSEYFFAKLDGEPFSEYVINRTFITCWKKSAGLKPTDRHPGNIRVYCLRHRFATAVIHRWLDEKQDLRSKLPYLQEYMGHDRLTDTVYYLHLLPENLLKSAGIDWETFDALIPEVWG